MRSRSTQVIGWSLLVVGVICLPGAAPAAGAAGRPPLVAGLASLPEPEPLLTGRLLLGELGCTACHTSQNPALAPKPGPDLTHAGSRLRADHLRRFIADPSGTKPGTTMPSVLAHLSPVDRDLAAAALSAYLVSLHDEPPPTDSVPVGAVDRGRALFHSVGCVACHAPEGQETQLPASVPLGPLDEKYSFSGLTAFLQGPLEVRRGGRMPDLHLDHREAADLAGYLLRDQDVPKPNSVPQTELIESGRRWFSELRCGSCHETGEREARTAATDLAGLRPALGCLSEADGVWPRYPLDDAQRAAIQAALAMEAVSSPIAPVERVRLELTRFNCVACHERDGRGGVATEREAYFTTRDPNLGEQGRIPPSLTGVGAKLRPEWFRKILVQGAPARPYCDTRMPAFGVEAARALPEAVSAVDRLAEVPAVAADDENAFKRAGRDLAGTDGLSCVTCHTYRGQQTGAMGALDLTLMAQRVTRDWFHRYLAAPQQFSPSTVMPAFWPEGRSPLPEVLGGDPVRQIEALWRYLSDGYSTDAPKGILREPMQLLASADEAVMLRRSYPGVGKRGIGVGYPGGVNLVFNAEQMCLATLWQGDFADPAGVWTSQGHGNVRPLGRTRIDFTNAPELAVMDRIDAPWPHAEGRPEDLRFRGYRLDSRRRPTFLYEIGKFRVEDSFEDLSEDGRTFLRRALTMASSTADARLVFRVAGGAEIGALGGDRFQVGNGLEVTVRSELPPRLVETAGGGELRVPVTAGADQPGLVLEYRWLRGSR